MFGIIRNLLAGNSKEDYFFKTVEQEEKTHLASSQDCDIIWTNKSLLKEFPFLAISKS